jgi:hypothetical protein
MDIREESLRAWQAQHGRQPDFETSVRLSATAMETAREVVRERLYDRIPLDEDGDAIPPEPVSGVPWEKRWMDHRYRSPSPLTPSPTTPASCGPSTPHDVPGDGGMLLAARLEERPPGAQDRRDQLAQDLVRDINEFLCRMNTPE